jgi:16S rRNA (adenine1518-N6/adenine1519-N6)-dimethyltransferase
MMKKYIIFDNLPGVGGKDHPSKFPDIEKPFPGPFTIIGNFPYNISSQILLKSGMER